MTEPGQRAGDRVEMAAGSLYRPEALLNSRSRLGRPTPIANVGSWVLVLFLASVMVAAIVFFATSSFARRETVSGLLSPTGGSSQLSYSKAAIVGAVHVREGQHVRKGEPIFTLELDTNLDQGPTLGDRLSRAAQEQGDALTAELDATARGSEASLQQLTDKRKALETQRGSLTESLDLQRQHLELDKATLEGLSSLVGKGFVSAIRLRDQQVQVLTDRQAIATLTSQMAENSAEQASAGNDIAQNRATAVQAGARFQQNRAELDEKKAEASAQRAVVLDAPYDGTVVTLRASAGEAVTPGSTLATIIPNGGGLQAELWAPTRAAGFARPGDEVRLMYDAFPFQRFGAATGRVLSISTTPIDPGQLPIVPDTKEAMFRIRVALDRQYVIAYGRHWQLNPGSRLRADLILDRQSLLAWVFDPLLASRKRETL